MNRILWEQLVPAQIRPGDEQHLLQTMQLAERGRAGARPNPVVGALLARGAEILATGYHATYGEPHAERVALAEASEVPAAATLYTSLEPCAHRGKQPPCADLIVERGVRRVAIASADPTVKTAGLGPARLSAADIEVVWAGPDLAAAALQQNAGFHSLALRGRPYVTCKWAMTRNGRFGTGDDDRRWVSSEPSRQLVHELRAAAGAIVVGIGTVMADDPLLTVRTDLAREMSSPPLRVVLDRDLQLAPNSQLAQTTAEAPVLVVCTLGADAARRDLLESCGVAVLEAPAGEELEATMRELARRGIADVLVEAGPRVLTSLEQAGLIDAAICFRAPFEADPHLPGLDPDSALLALFDGIAPALSGSDELFVQVLKPVAGFFPHPG